MSNENVKLKKIIISHMSQKSIYVHMRWFFMETYLMTNLGLKQNNQDYLQAANNRWRHRLNK